MVIPRERSTRDVDLGSPDAANDTGRLTQCPRPPAETRLIDGPPAAALAELAHKTDADEIVVGSRGMGRFAAALGSVSHALLAHDDRARGV
jgi:nucleotide-binding universal stress UspA family protein